MIITVQNSKLTTSLVVSEKKKKKTDSTNFRSEDHESVKAVEKADTSSKDLNAKEHTESEEIKDDAIASLVASNSTSAIDEKAARQRIEECRTLYNKGI